MSRIAAMLFAIIAYAIFFATFLYLIVFVGDFAFAELTVDNGPGGDPVTASFIDIGLIALFGLQHSVMARQGFKRWWMHSPAADRAQRLRARRKRYADDPVPLLASDRRDRMEPRPDYSSPGDRPHLDRVLGRLADRASEHVPDQPFRALRAAAGLVPPSRPGGRAAEVPPALFYKWVRHPLYLGFFLPSGPRRR